MYSTTSRDVYPLELETEEQEKLLNIYLSRLVPKELLVEDINDEENIEKFNNFNKNQSKIRVIGYNFYNK